MKHWYNKKIVCGAGPNPSTALRAYGARRAGLFARAPQLSASAKLRRGDQFLAFTNVQ